MGRYPGNWPKSAFLIGISLYVARFAWGPLSFDEPPHRSVSERRWESTTRETFPTGAGRNETLPGQGISDHATGIYLGLYILGI